MQVEGAQASPTNVALNKMYFVKKDVGAIKCLDVKQKLVAVDHAAQMRRKDGVALQCSSHRQVGVIGAFVVEEVFRS